MRSLLLTVLVTLVLIAAPSRAQTALTAAPFPTYTEGDANYRLGAGDQIEVAVYSASDLTRTVTIAPDGRITLPMIGAVMAANRTSRELQDALVTAYAPYLRSPEIEVLPRVFGSQQIFVGGEVSRPGIYEMTAGMDALQAIASAGGFTGNARDTAVLILTRKPDGSMDVRTLDLSVRAMEHALPGLSQLSRFDVVYIPRSGIAEVNRFMQQYVRDALPIQFGFYYDLRGGN